LPSSRSFTVDSTASTLAVSVFICSLLMGGGAPGCCRSALSSEPARLSSGSAWEVEARSRVAPAPGAQAVRPAARGRATSPVGRGGAVAPGGPPLLRCALLTCSVLSAIRPVPPGVVFTLRIGGSAGRGHGRDVEGFLTLLTVGYRDVN